MPVNPELIERIYEAAARPELWPGVLQGAADAAGAAGVCFVHRGPDHAGWVLSERMDAFGDAYIAEGWLDRDGRVPPIIAEHYPGFRVDADYWTEEQVRDMPVYRDFLLPRGLKASAACALQGARDDALHVGVEGLAGYTEARRALPTLDALRPHLARAVSLSVQLSKARLDASVSALNLAGVPAAVIARDGRFHACNERFSRWLGARHDTRAGRIRFADRVLQGQVEAALATLNRHDCVRSVAVAAPPGETPFALHLVPLRRSARDVFGTDGVLVLVAEAANASVPTADLLRLLFDLTPAEARLTRLLVEGKSQTEAGALLGITANTARTHLRRVFGKTGVTRQAELVRLLAGLGAPSSG